MTRINPNSSIRSGYTFEDLHVLKYCVEWLLDPRSISQIQIQYVPLELRQKRFAIDDITVSRSDGTIEYYQLKHRQNPQTDPWDFSGLLEKGLAKWIRSYLELSNLGSAYCALVTNGSVSAELEICLDGGKLDIEILARLFPERYLELSREFSHAELCSFFSGFEFRFAESELPDMELSLREVMYKQLKVTKAGVDSLMLYIISQGREKYPRAFTLEEIRDCLSWDNPRPLNQNFEIPADFEFFDRGFHENLLNELRGPKGGIKVFTGKPGSGKSTYLSKLYTVLRKSGIMTFRHHYHLNPKDASFAERLNSDRVKEALKAEFKKQKNSVLGELGEINTHHIQIRDFIDRIAGYHRIQGTTFVIIVDGLDHVIREGKNRQALVDFLNDLLYPQAGFWLIFGTQEMATPCFPRVVEDLAPRDSWIEIRGLGRSQVAKIARKSLPGLAGRQHRDYFRESVDILFNRCAGNPLHLRYILEEVRNVGGNISNYDLERLAPYGGDISVYYSSLWNSLSDLAKSFCYAITALDFKLHKEQLFSLGAHLCRYPSEVTAAFKDIAHLIRIELSGISVYHNSFQVFMGNQPELKEQQTALYLVLRKWLKSPSQEALRWSELAKVEYYLGNPGPLLSLDNDWVISSYLDCRDERQIEKLLDLACRAAFENNQPGKVVYFSIASTYFAGRKYNLSDTLDPLWSTSFRSRPDLKVSYPDFAGLSHYQIKEILIHLKSRGLIDDIPVEAIDRMNLLFRDHNISNGDLVRNWILVLVAFGKTDNRVFGFIKQFRSSSESAVYLAFYLKQLIAAGGDRRAVESVLKLKLIGNEREAVLEVLMESDLRSGSYTWRELIGKSLRKGKRTCNYYCIFSGLREVKPWDLTTHNAFPDEYEYHSSSKTEESIALYDGVFEAAYFNILDGKKEVVDRWLNRPSERWPVQLAKVAVRMAVMLASDFTTGRRIRIADLLACFEGLRMPDFSHDFKIYELRRAIVPHLIDKVVWLAQLSNVRNGKDTKLTSPEFDLLYHHKWYYQARMFDLVQQDRVLIADDALESFLDQELGRLRAELSPFGDKAKAMMNLALLYKDFQGGVHLPRLLWLTARQMIGYGYHKDMFMYNILQGIEILAESGSAKVGLYLNRIMPYVYYIERLTDGDETSHFISMFYGLVAGHDNQLLYNFYLHRLDTREYLDSDLLWGHVVHTLDMGDPVARALANTAIDHSGFTALIEDLQKPGVQEVIASIQSKFGQLDYSAKDKQEPGFKPERKSDSFHLRVKPGALQQHLSDRRSQEEFTRFDDQGFLSDWAAHWLKQPGHQPAEVLKEIQSALGEKPWDYGNQVLETMYPYALKVDRNLAFQLLCWKMVQIGGWNSNYMTHMEDVRPIWQQVIRTFPDRTGEFYKWTVTHSGLRYGEELDYAFPMPKSVQFFADADQLELAEELVDHYLDGLDGLFPDVHLPVPEFWTAPKQVTVLDLLLRRLEWMSPLVRCRASEELAALLIGDTEGVLHDHFYRWLNSINLESVACHGLLVVIRSLGDPDSSTFRHLGQLRLGMLLKVRCMATDLLLQRIANLLKVRLAIGMPRIIRIGSENPEIDVDHFKELISRNLTVSYLDYLEDLEEDSPFSVWQAWLFMYKERCEEMDLIYQTEDESYENRGRSVIVGRNTIFAEILKSTFFLILDGLYDMGYIDYSTLFRMTLKNLPIDPSVWAVSPGRQPGWWPVFKMSLLKSGEEYPEITEPLLNSFSQLQDQTVLFLNTTYFEGTEFYEAETFCSQQIIAFAYPAGRLPTHGADRIFKEMNGPGFYYPNVNSPSNFGVLNNELLYYGEKDHIDQLQPLSAPLKIFAHHIWEHFRIYNTFRLLHPILAGGLDIRPMQSSIGYLKKEKVVAMCSDFMSGLRETMNPNVRLVPHSSYLTIDTAHLMGVLERDGLLLAHVIREEFSYKDKPYDDKWPKPFVRFRLMFNT
ncbi:MAG: ATP-binding protein [Sphingobacteriales bacterium]|nr:MAG: ATP-binding protein [Sphingobacteriales bacterium]